MPSGSPGAPSDSAVLVVGAGIIGLMVAWRLAELGHPVTLVDPVLARGAPPEGSGSQAALGVLMARVFHRSAGRAWRLRQQSLQLWEQWLAELEGRGHRLPRRRGLLLLAASAEELARQERLADDRAQLGIPMERLRRKDLEVLQPRLPEQALGGLLSPQDGQLDPSAVMEALRREAKRLGVACMAERAVAIRRRRSWQLELEGGAGLEAPWLVLALGLGTAPLLASLDHSLALEPVLGQALELELATEPHWSWPGAVVWRGINLVPRPDLASGGRRLWLGATLEPGEQASTAALAVLRQLGGEAPTWLREATVVREWQGLRGHPQGTPAPVLDEPEPGLLIASGHYRNGVLLAPATAAWVCGRIHGVQQMHRASGA
jgi:glycine/D-amino acid oxidase-like deaminating enzyme